MIIRLLLLFFLLHPFHKGQSSSPDAPSIFMSVFIKENDQLIPFFLKSIDKLAYDKNRIHLKLHICNTSPDVHALVSTWAAKNNIYKSMECVDCSSLFLNNPNPFEKNKILAQIKDENLAQSKKLECEYFFLLSSEAFLFPHTLSHLLQKKEPIIAPMLRPLPEANDPFRNFFLDVTENGYYKDHPDYLNVARRQKKGTFLSPCVHSVYLIDTKFADELSFSKNFVNYEFLSFSKNAREKKISQYICNEKEFGFFLHFLKDMTLQEEKAFSLVGTETEITPQHIQNILSPYYIGDPDLQKYAEHFPEQNYALYPYQNRELFYLDDVNDYIKNFIIKQNLPWEEIHQKEFKKYVRPDSVVLDIGGHIGTHSITLSKLVGEHGTVHVFEPQSKMFCELAINTHLNGCKNVQLHHKALGKEHKLVHMSIPPEEWTKWYGIELLNEGHGTVTETQETGDTCQMICLDDLQLQNVSFIKMDVEGYEMNVIHGGMETIKRCKPVMIIEIFQGPERIKKIKEIEALGYMHNHLFGDDFIFIPLHMTQTSSIPVKEEKQQEHSFTKPVDVAWSGSFLDYGSLSHVNRSLTDELIKMKGVQLTRVTNEITCKPEFQHVFKTVQKSAPPNSEITIHHSFPPNWQSPKSGKWVLMQPWEYGAIPEEWVDKIKNIDEVWTPSQFVKDMYIVSGVPNNKVHVLPHGIDPGVFHPQVKPFPLNTKKKFKFLYVGGGLYRKGIDLLVNSYLSCFSQNDDVVLVIKDSKIYAKQSIEPSINDAKKILNAAEIIYLDQDMSYDEMASLYKACDCYVHPYRGEGFALPVLEAMACGLPVIVTKGGPTDEFVQNQFGWFIPSEAIPIDSSVYNDIQLAKPAWMLEPDVQVLSALLRWVPEHSQEARKKGLVASQYVRKNWTWQKAAQKTAARLYSLSK